MTVGRMGRSISGCAGSSLVRCLVMVGLWARSYRAVDFLTWRVVDREPTGFREGGLESVHGSVHLAYLSSPASLRASEPAGLVYERIDAGNVRMPRGTLARRWGFGHDRMANAAGLSYRSVWVPHWLLAMVTAALPGAWLVRRAKLRTRRRRLRLGLCPACGYDLRATPGQCPECGAVAGGGRAGTAETV